ncbi:hypothetical protein [Dactylosporangium sp. CA-233914]|uniref:hypothetical protein n=1 Tax=Dactylosporangium sp. CA-233914 TaxID=3239934 RepID=UPI003D8FD23D
MRATSHLAWCSPHTAGLPYRCATSTTAAYSCMNPGVDKTPAAVAVWHGTADTTLAPANAKVKVYLVSGMTHATPVDPAPPPSSAAPPPPTTSWGLSTGGPAHHSGGYTYANGSNQAMGLDNRFTTHGLRQTGANSYVLDDTAC